jgi:predicted metalloprotease with PDZ domain
VENRSHVPSTYSFDDVVKALNAVQTYDWAGFLRERLDGHANSAPKDGLMRAGWKLQYTDERSEFFKSVEEMRHIDDFSYSLGLTVNRDGRIDDVIWDGVAFKNGLTIGTTLVAVNGLAYKSELLKDALIAAKGNKQSIELLLKKDDRYRTVHIDYHDGLKYPHLVRIDGSTDRLSNIFAPL